jgi:hypothetical protein
MSNELSAAEKFFEEVLIDLMVERVMSKCGMSTGIILGRTASFPLCCSSRTILTAFGKTI